MKIQVCTRKNDDAKFNFYPYILLTSAFFLLLVVIVYAVFPKVRYNNSQRLRLHFAANMLAAFVILITNQLTDIGNMNMVACQVFGTDMKRAEDTVRALIFFFIFVHFFTSGFLQQFFFLVAFTFMTLICVNAAVGMST